MFTHFYSDSHFGHKGIIELCDRPFKDKEEMNEALIANYNEAVGPKDRVLWVGDGFFLSANRTRAILARLNGTKALVKGNHDRSCRVMVELGFEFACEELYLNISGVSVRVNHYPYASGARGDDERDVPYPVRKNEKVLIHGHTHSDAVMSGNMIHVGCDAWDYYPVDVGMIEEFVACIA